MVCKRANIYFHGVLFVIPFKLICNIMVIDGHGWHTALHFEEKSKENQDKVPTWYWLPKLHKTL